MTWTRRAVALSVLPSVVLLAACLASSGTDGRAGPARSADLPSLAAAVAKRPPGPRLNIAHRGASGHAPEHTLLAYDLALQMGADYIEQDLQLTRDGVLVVLHDATLDRTARGPAEHCTGRVIEKTLAQLRTCDVGSWFNETYPEYARPEHVGLRIPTLEEVFQRYRQRTSYYIETKNPEEAPGMEEALLRLLDAYQLREPAAVHRRVLIQSFSPTSLQKIHTLAPELPLVQLFSSRESSESIRRGLAQVAEYAVGVGPSKSDVDATLVEAAHARCLGIHPYTVNESTEMASLLALGVDGMFTNFPDRLEALLGRAAAGGEHGGNEAADAPAACRAGP